MSREKSEPNAAAWFYGQPGFHGPTRKPQDIAGGQEKAWPWCAPCESYHHPDNPTCVLVAPASVQDQERPTVVDDDCCNHRVCCAHNVEHPPAPHIAKAGEPPAWAMELADKGTLNALRDANDRAEKAEARVRVLEAEIRDCEAEHPLEPFWFQMLKNAWAALDTSSAFIDPSTDPIILSGREVVALNNIAAQQIRAALAESADRGEEKA